MDTITLGDALGITLSEIFGSDAAKHIANATQHLLRAEAAKAEAHNAFAMAQSQAEGVGVDAAFENAHERGMAYADEYLIQVSESHYNAAGELELAANALRERTHYVHNELNSIIG